jgi:hypothetical protein
MLEAFPQASGDRQLDEGLHSQVLGQIHPIVQLLLAGIMLEALQCACVYVA